MGKKFMNYFLFIGFGLLGFVLKFIRNELYLEDFGSVLIFLGIIVGFLLLFFVICVVGICGNFFVVCVVICNKKMRIFMINLLIINLVFVDFFIMVFGILEIILLCYGDIIIWVCFILIVFCVER